MDMVIWISLIIVLAVIVIAFYMKKRVVTTKIMNEVK